jgi:hypothetical protein
MQRLDRIDFNPSDAVERANDFKAEAFVERFGLFVQQSIAGRVSPALVQ